MKDLNNEQKILKKIQPQEAIETLGVNLTPNGTDDIQCEVLRSKTTNWANKIKKVDTLAVTTLGPA